MRDNLHMHALTSTAHEHAVMCIPHIKMGRRRESRGEEKREVMMDAIQIIPH